MFCRSQTSGIQFCQNFLFLYEKDDILGQLNLLALISDEQYTLINRLSLLSLRYQLLIKVTKG